MDKDKIMLAGPGYMKLSEGWDWRDWNQVVAGQG